MTDTERNELRVSLLIVERILAIGVSDTPGMAGWWERAEYRKRKRRAEWIRVRLNETAEMEVGK